MKTQDSISHMSKLHLDKVINSFSKNIKKFNEDDARKFLAKNVKDILDEKRVESQVAFITKGYFEKNMLTHILKFVLTLSKFEIAEDQFYKEYLNFQKEEINRINGEAIKFIPTNVRSIFMAVVEVIFEDQSISRDEERILTKLQQKFSLTDVELLAIIRDVTGKLKNEKLEMNQFFAYVKELQALGLMFYLNKKVDKRKYIIPEELAKILSIFYKYPLGFNSFTLLLDNASKGSISSIAKKKELPYSGTKSEIIKRLWDQGYTAYKVLSEIDKPGLRSIAKPLEGVRISGAKEIIIDSVLGHFFDLETDKIDLASIDSIDNYWNYIEDFACRNYNKLRQLKLISKDLDIEHGFEKVTRHVFKKKIGLELLKFSGSNNPDGGVFDKDNSKVLLWDNKSQEEAYVFPNSHQKQFLQYVKQSKYKVSSFLIITSVVQDEDMVNVNAIKFQSMTGINVAILEASVFKQFIDKYGNGNGSPSIEVFNHNGCLSLNLLEKRVKIYR